MKNQHERESKWLLMIWGLYWRLIYTAATCTALVTCWSGDGHLEGTVQSPLHCSRAPRVLEGCSHTCAVVRPPHIHSLIFQKNQCSVPKITQRVVTLARIKNSLKNEIDCLKNHVILQRITFFKIVESCLLFSRGLVERHSSDRSLTWCSAWIFFFKWFTCDAVLNLKDMLVQT